MGPGRREAFFHATELADANSIEHIVWTEPEKADLIRFVSQIVEPIDAVRSPIVIPKRSELAWSSWPAFQRKSEEEANAVYNEVFGTKGFDPMFGPVAFHVLVAETFIRAYPHPADYMDVVPDMYIQHYAPVFWKVLHPDSAVLSVEIDMQYPREQREQEEGSANDAMLEKRKMQLETLTKAYRAIAEAYIMA